MAVNVPRGWRKRSAGFQLRGSKVKIIGLRNIKKTHTVYLAYINVCLADRALAGCSRHTRRSAVGEDGRMHVCSRPGDISAR